MFRALQTNRILASAAKKAFPVRYASQHVVISASGPDKVGIVGALTKEIQAFDANLEDSRMTVLGSDFSMIMLATIPDSVNKKDMESKLQVAFPSFLVGLRETTHVAEKANIHGDDGITLSVTLQGPDQPGLVRSFTEILLNASGTIIDLSTNVYPAPFAGYTEFELSAEVQVPKDQRAALNQKLREYEDEFGMFLIQKSFD